MMKQDKKDMPSVKKISPTFVIEPSCSVEEGHPSVLVQWCSVRGHFGLSSNFEVTLISELSAVFELILTSDLTAMLFTICSTVHYSL